MGRSRPSRRPGTGWAQSAPYAGFCSDCRHHPVAVIGVRLRAVKKGAAAGERKFGVRAPADPTGTIPHGSHPPIHAIARRLFSPPAVRQWAIDKRKRRSDTERVTPAEGWSSRLARHRAREGPSPLLNRHPGGALPRRPRAMPRCRWPSTLRTDYKRKLGSVGRRLAGNTKCESAVRSTRSTPAQRPPAAAAETPPRGADAGGARRTCSWLALFH